MTCWQVLGIECTRDRGTIRRAYAAQLKLTNPEDDAEGFKRLRAAYEEALSYADSGWSMPPPLASEAIHVAVEPTASTTAIIENALPDDRLIDRTTLDAALNRLQAALRSPSSEAALRAAFEAVATARAMGTIDVRNDTEQRLAWLLARTIPQSDPLLVAAIDYFRWDTGDARANIPQPVQRLLQRQKDISLLHVLAQHKHVHNKAFEALSAPPRPITLLSRLFPSVTPAQVEAFLDSIVRPQPSLRGDLDAETVEMWQAFLQRPHLTTWGLWSLLLSVPALILGALFLTIVPPDYRSLGVLTILPPSSALAALAYTYGLDLPQRKWRERRMSSRAWSRWGWIGAFAALAAVAGQPSRDGRLTIIALALAVLTSTWVVAAGEPDKRPSNYPWQLRAIMGEFYLVVWGCALALSSPVPSVLRIVLLLVTAMVVSAFARIPLYRAWIALPHRTQRTAAVGMAILTLAGIVALWQVRLLPMVYPAAIAAITLIVLAYRGLTLVITAWWLRLKYISFMIALFIASLVGEGGVLMVGGSLLLVWAVAPVLRASLGQRSPAG